MLVDLVIVGYLLCLCISLLCCDVCVWCGLWIEYYNVLVFVYLMYDD